MRRLVCVIGALALGAGAAGASTVSSGLRGTVVAVPGGACLEGDGCSKRPVANATLSFTLDARTARTTTHADGSFRVRLAPGTYSVRVGSDTGARAVTPTRALVVRGRFRAMTFVVASPKIP